MAVTAADVIGPALRHAKEQLLSPFRLGQWVRLAVVGLLAGEMTSGGCSFNLPPGGGGSGDSSDNFALQAMQFPQLLVLAGMITILIAIGIVLWLVFLYISSMMRFVLFESILARECRIIEFWQRRRTEGFRYFVWQLGFTAVTVFLLLVLVGFPAFIAFRMGVFQNPWQHLALLILGGLILGLLFATLILAATIVYVLTKDFVVPQMACEGITAMEGWRRLWPMIESEKGGYAIYVLLKAALSIAAGIVIFIAMFAVLLVLLIPVGGFGIFTVLLGQAIGLTWNVLTITIAVVAGIVVVALILFISAMLSVPAIVFFPAYSLYFFADRYPALASRLHPPPTGPPPMELQPE